ncbi:MAG: Mrp/NBP35 family ATP-binding protein [Tannerella sp.]|jgi:ATP-binding protein involved in chromosome partitioning|nr:Mrp/NBP35 family ATP-binding protein [Tannerella sp.]
MTIYPKLIIEALEKVRYPGSGQNIVEAGMLGDDIRIEGMKVSFSLIFKRMTDPFLRSVVKAAEQAVLTYVSPDVEIQGNIRAVAPESAPAKAPAVLPEVANIIAIASGKGGVGKSTVSANLAVALAVKGYRVGLLDADIFGPSQPKMFDVEDYRPPVRNVDGRDLIVPAEKYGVKLLSIGFFVDRNDALVWRGPMAGNALKQLITEGDWGALDYLLIDLPPGTSDIHLTLVQTVTLTGAIVVSTPQEVAIADARKAVSMFQGEKINVPVIGLIENMAWFTPAELPENKYFIFGRGGCAKLSGETGIPLLGQIPVVQSICESGDAGEPVALHSDTVTGSAFMAIASAL